jgi:crotonobetainyl-CoA:carnitine CoA-transferase CaiB-like acyl-CoA transferase
MSRRVMKLLEHTCVLDLSFGGSVLLLSTCQLGAQVIKLEVPAGGDLARQLGADGELNHALMGASFLAQNAGKRSLTINLKTVGGKEIFRRLVARADVVVERLGFGYAALQAIKPNLMPSARQ